MEWWRTWVGMEQELYWNSETLVGITICAGMMDKSYIGIVQYLYWSITRAVWMMRKHMLANIKWIMPLKLCWIFCIFSEGHSGIIYTLFNTLVLCLQMWIACLLKLYPVPCIFSGHLGIIYSHENLLGWMLANINCLPHKLYPAYFQMDIQG